MQRGDDNEQQQNLTSAEISDYSATTLWFTGTPYNTSIVSGYNAPTYTDIIRVLSEVELPSPSPVLPTTVTLVREENPINFDEGQPSGTKKVDEIEGNVELERELKVKNDINQEPGTQREAPETRSAARRYRSRIHERIRALKELIPNCNKRDQASILGDAIDYIKSLQMQLHMMQCMGLGAMAGHLMSPTMHPSIQVPCFAPYFQMLRPMIGMGYSAGQYSSFTPSLPIFPPFLTGFNPSVAAMLGIGSPRYLPIPRLQIASQSAEPVYSTTVSLERDAIIPTTVSQVGSGISSQLSYHMPVMSQEMQQASITRFHSPSDLLVTRAQIHDSDSDGDDSDSDGDQEA